MTKKYLKISFVLLLGLGLSFAAYRLCYFVAEKYYFDKFFYFKSISHGYFVPGSKDNDLKKYGDRAKDIIALNSPPKNVLGVTSDNYYKIAIIGDSFVWGQGIKNHQRFAYLLEKELNKIRPTKVYSLGNNGDNIFEDYQKYKQSLATFGPMNLYIFGLYNNDLVFNHDDRYKTGKLLSENLTVGCSGNALYDPEFNPTDLNGMAFYQAKLMSLKEGSVNLCAFNKLVPLLPKHNTIYIDLGSMEDDHEVKRDFSQVMSQNLSLISLQPSDNIKARVSVNESHPSAYSNQLFADTLFHEITTDPQYQFHE
jgi:hypothetical protein